MSQNCRDVKFERDLLKTNEDIVPQSRFILERFAWCIQTSVNLAIICFAPRGGTIGISGWGCAAGTLEPLT